MRGQSSLDDAPDEAPSVLVVDDDTMFITLLTMQLRSHGYPSRGARSASHALHQLAQEPTLRAVICDANLPGGGAELIQELTRTRPDLYVLVVSGLSTLEIAELGIAASVPTVQKPISASTLARLLTAAEVLPVAAPSTER